MNLQVGVKAIILSPQNQILLIRRSDNYGDIAGMWDIPGGRIQPEEDLATGLRRELLEEIGWTIQGTPVLVDAQDIMRPSKQLHVVRLTYVIRGATLQPSLSDEHTEFMAADLHTLDSVDLDPYLVESLKKL